MPLSRAFQISLNSLKIRFWRSIITAGGIFLGIAFLSTILTQSLMQWPVPEKIEPGYIRISGQVVNPYDFEAWKPIPLAEGRAAGIPQPVLGRVAPNKSRFSLTDIVQGIYQARRADKNLARVLKEWQGLKKLRPIQFYVDAKDNKDLTPQAAIKAGVPAKIAKRLAGKNKTFKGADLVDLIKDKPKWVRPIYSQTAQDLDVQVGDALDAGVPESIAKLLTGEGKSFKGTALNEAVNVNHPKWMKIWRARVKRYAIFKTVPDSAIRRLNRPHVISLADILALSKTPLRESRRATMSAEGRTIDPDRTNIMIVNADGRRQSVNLQADPDKAREIKLRENDLVFVPDRNSRYRMMWLVVMSLLVCTVGISNSMLMAVTERFKEIGTMKCLGALDRFVVTLFMLESGMMGIAASVLGWATGFAIMILIAGLSKGWDIVATLNLADIVKVFGGSIGIGLVLTVLATIAPAWQAARMPAAMALRSEV